ncbi:MAG: hypothetical protein QXN26_03970 [Thermoplasmataceae archaeon]
MGHKGDIEKKYTKREGKIDEGRDQYAMYLKFIETEHEGISEEDQGAYQELCSRRFSPSLTMRMQS